MAGRNWAQTDGHGRHQADYYVQHEQAQAAVVRQLCRTRAAVLQAEQFQPALAMVEAKCRPRSRHTVKQIGAIADQIQGGPGIPQPGRILPLWSLLTIYLLAVLCEGPARTEGPGEVWLAP